MLASGTLVRADGRAWIIDRYFVVSAMQPRMRAAAHRRSRRDDFTLKVVKNLRTSANAP
jgi:pyrroloquinoline quinone (PQQ) biosynthesis protein C